MANLHEYVESSSKEGYYLLEGYNGDALTYQLPDFAEKVLLNLGYEDEDRIANEVFYLLLNLDLIYTHESGIEPVETLDALPDFASDKMSSLSPKQREELLNMLLAHGSLTPQQQEELENYAQEREIDASNRSKFSEWSNGKNEHNIFNFRIQNYDDYMLAVDKFRLLRPASERLDIHGEEVDSPLVAELESAKIRMDTMKKECDKHPSNLRTYRNELGTPQETQLLKKDDLNKNGLAIPTGDGETIIVSYEIPKKDHDIVVPENWKIPSVRPRNDSTDQDDIRLEDLSEKTRKKLMDQAREEMVAHVTKFMDSYQ